MKITKKAISRLSVRARNRLALELDCSVQTIERWIRLNEDNGGLTKALALQIISEETELDQSEILEEVVATA